jgi:hypothetical protein
MPSPIPGLHLVTAVASDPQRNPLHDESTTWALEMPTTRSWSLY